MSTASVKKRDSTGTISLDPEKDLGTPPSTEIDPEFERKTIRYVDFRLLPLLSLLYAFALIDRINLGVARTAGMGKALGLHIGSRFTIATCLYFVPYILLQIPGNAVVRWIGARKLLVGTVLTWGAVELGMGFVPTWQLLTMCRVLLGALEATFFPALVFIITSWYKRHEVQKRLAAFYLTSLTATGFSSILAYGLSTLDGLAGIDGWAWIFIIEGVITMGLGVVTFYFIPDFPDKNNFLTPQQTQLVLKRIEDDRGDSVPDEINLRVILHHLSDWTLWAYGVMFACETLPAYAIAYFISVILKGMGFSTTTSLLLSAPPYGPAFISAMFFAWISDKRKHRGTFIALQGLITLVGCCLMAFPKTRGVQYFGSFLVNTGSAGCVPTILAYGSNNVVSQSKRAVQTALTIAFGGVGGIIASTVFREKDAPHYIPGLWVTMGAQFLLFILVGITTLHFRRLNRLSREGKLAKPLENQPGFYYTL